MCGIAGVICFDGKVDRGVLSQMTQSLERRGPDGFGMWLDNSQSIGLGHRRLSILDLSNSANQPMQSLCNRYVLVFNGEIYNHLDIRGRLRASFADIQFRGTGDTETLLAAIAAWGFEKTLITLNGMFAIAVWDKKYRRLYLARDRVGEKPLYFAKFNSSFIFGSQINALACHGDWQGKLDKQSVQQYTRLNYVPAPATIFQNVFKLRPAEFVVVDHAGIIQKKQTYWSCVPCSFEKQRLENTVEKQLEQLESVLIKGVQSRMLSDVPIGAFLSGGVDSSLVTALMQANSSRPIKTFSIGSDNSDADEALHARQVARYIGSDHTELYVSHNDVKTALPQMAKIFDEPFADASQIPTFLVSQLAAKEVKVVLSGDGGDELFAGYNRHFLAPKIWKSLRLVPMPVRRLVSYFLCCASSLSVRQLKQVTGGRIQGAEGKIQLYKLARALQAGTHSEFYELLQTNWIPSPCTFAETLSIVAKPFDKWEGEANFLKFMLQKDFDRFLPDDVLVKLDRASMASSLEARAPFLDHQVVEFARAFLERNHQQFKSNETKWPLKMVLSKYLPRELWDRPKQGFHAPIEKWLRNGELKDWMQDLLSPSSLFESNIFDPVIVEKRLETFLDGDDRPFFNIWNVLTFQAWHRENKERFKISV